MNVVASVHFKRLWTGDSIPSIMKTQPTEGQRSPDSSSSLLVSQDHFTGTSKALQEENAVTMNKRRSHGPTSFQQTVTQLIVLELQYAEIFTVNTFYIYLKKARSITGVREIEMILLCPGFNKLFKSVCSLSIFCYSISEHVKGMLNITQLYCCLP